MKAILLTAFLSSLFLSACGNKPGFQSLAVPSSTVDGTNGGQNSGGTDPGKTPVSGEAPANWEKVEMNGYPSGGNYKGQLVVYIDKVKQSLLMVLPIPALIPMITPVGIQELEGAYLTSYQDPAGNTLLAVNVPLKYIVREGKFMPNQRLPNGDPLPFIPAGELPGFGIEFPQMSQYQIHLYIGVNVAAVFVELPDFGLPFGWISQVKNKTNTRVIGAIGYVPPKNNFDGGMYMAAQLPADLARVIDELIRW